MPSGSAYFLTTARLGFRRWTPEDLPLAETLWGDPKVTRFLGGPFTREQVGERFSTELARAAELGIQSWPIFRRATDEFVGGCGLRPYRPAERILEMGFQLTPASWGQGLATEAGRAVVAYAFEHREADAIVAGHHPSNEGSRRVLEKIGFRRIGEELYPPTGLVHPLYRIRPADLPGGV
jgi:ribosomal-protein-alanine N-acetyltransferase